MEGSEKNGDLKHFKIPPPLWRHLPLTREARLKVPLAKGGWPIGQGDLRRCEERSDEAIFSVFPNPLFSLLPLAFPLGGDRQLYHPWYAGTRHFTCRRCVNVPSCVPSRDSDSPVHYLRVLVLQPLEKKTPGNFCRGFCVFSYKCSSNVWL